jgi:hypothetical protein
MQAPDRIGALVEHLRNQDAARAKCLDALRQFMVWFREGIHEALAVSTQLSGAAPEVVVSSMPADLLRFVFTWEDNRVIVAPVPIVAPPDRASRALPTPDIQEPAGRVLVFIQHVSIHDSASAIAEIYVFGQRTWCAAGLGHPVGMTKLEKTEVSDYAVTLLEQLTHSLARQHRPLDATEFDFASSSVREPIGFGRSS